MLKNKIMYVLLLMVLIGFYVGYDNILSFIVLLTTIAVPFLMLIVLRRAGTGLSAESIKPKLAQAKGKEISIGAVIKNTTVFPLSNAVITFEYMNTLDRIPHKLSASIPIQANNSQEIRFSLSSRYCGKIIVCLKSIVYYDYLKLFSRKLDINQENEILITPTVHAIDAVIGNTLESDIESDIFSKVKSGDDCSEVFAVKEYVPGDKVNRIHWKLSTKQDKLMVKEYSLPIKSSVLILFEFFSDKSNANYMENLDALVESALSLSDVLTQNEIIHTISWYNAASKQFCSNVISDENDIGIFLGQLFKASSYGDSLHAYSSHSIINEEKRFSHVFYIAPTPSEKTVRDFSMQKNAMRKTVLSIADKAHETKSADFDYDTSLISIISGNISSCISELVI